MLTKEYLESMRVHVDEGGHLNHRNGLDLLAEVERLNLILNPPMIKVCEELRTDDEAAP